LKQRFFRISEQANSYESRRTRRNKPGKLAFNNLVKLLHEKEIIPKEDLKESIELIEQKDNRKIDKDGIFQGE